MRISIDGVAVETRPGQSLLELVRQLGMDMPFLAKRPLAAELAGEVFTLNYVPERENGSTMRRAMEVSGGEIRLLRYQDAPGREAYIRSMQFLIFLALHRCFPQAEAKISCTLGNSAYISVSGEFDASLLATALRSLVEANIPFERRRIPMEEAVQIFQALGRQDKVDLLQWRDSPWFDGYFFGDYADELYGELLPSSGYLTVWELLPADGGFVFLYPDRTNPDVTADFSSMPHFFEVFSEGERWCRLMECESAAELNALTVSGNIRELIRVNEALHEKRFSQVADQVCSRGARMVMLAGPSSSGKTTSANRLATQLRVHGKKPILMSLDDYYLDRDTIAPGPDGKLDLEHINTIDTALFRQNMADLLNGREVELPIFRFTTGKREWTGKKLKLSEDSVIIVEGLHALNPVMLPQGVPQNQVFRLYVSPLIPLNLDDHNRIPTSYLRLLRRIVRDYETRGASVQHTLSMWDSVRKGEALWIFPFQENADVIFNSSTLYELAVLKKHIYPLLKRADPEEECLDAVRSIVRILDDIQLADVDDELPPTSLVREFVGGNSFYR